MHGCSMTEREKNVHRLTLHRFQTGGRYTAFVFFRTLVKVRPMHAPSISPFPRYPLPPASELCLDPSAPCRLSSRLHICCVKPINHKEPIRRRQQTLANNRKALVYRSNPFFLRASVYFTGSDILMCRHSWRNLTSSRVGSRVTLWWRGCTAV